MRAEGERKGNNRHQSKYTYTLTLQDRVTQVGDGRKRSKDDDDEKEGWYKRESKKESKGGKRVK